MKLNKDILLLSIIAILVLFSCYVFFMAYPVETKTTTGTVYAIVEDKGVYQVYSVYTDEYGYVEVTGNRYLDNGDSVTLVKHKRRDLPFGTTESWGNWSVEQSAYRDAEV